MPFSRAIRICWTRMIDVTAAIDGVTSGPQRSSQRRRASAIGSNRRSVAIVALLELRMLGVGDEHVLHRKDHLALRGPHLGGLDDRCHQVGTALSRGLAQPRERGIDLALVAS